MSVLVLISINIKLLYLYFDNFTYYVIVIDQASRYMSFNLHSTRWPNNPNDVGMTYTDLIGQ